MKTIKKTFLIWLLLIGVIHANVIPVPATQPTIQAGIDAAP